MSAQGTDRFVLNLAPGKTPEETASRTMQELIRLTGQLNSAGVPIVIGPNDSLPEGIRVNQPVIDWSTGTSVLKVWDGENLV